jgi:hypothetical protein
MTRGKPNDGTKNPGGRPVEWTPELIEDMGNRLVTWAQNHNALYLESFCKSERTYPQKLTEFAAKNQKFSESLKIAKCANAANIGEAVAAGEIPPAVGIFGLKQHGHTEKHEVSGANGGPLDMVMRVVFVDPKPDANATATA